MTSLSSAGVAMLAATALVQTLSSYLTPNEINNYYTYPAFPLAAPAVAAAVETVPPDTASAWQIDAERGGAGGVARRVPAL